MTKWAYIARVDENGNYRISFVVNPEQDQLLQEAIIKCIKENGKDAASADWFGSRKETEDGIEYSAKCAQKFKNKQGEEITRELSVYDRKAVKLDEVPNIANGAICNVDVEVYFAKYQKKYGAMLSLRGVQLITYEEYTGGNNFEPEPDEEPIDIKEDNSIFE